MGDRRRTEVKKLPCASKDIETESTNTEKCTSVAINNEDHVCTDQSQLAVSEISQLSRINEGLENQITSDLDDKKIVGDDVNMIKSSTGNGAEREMLPNQCTNTHNFETIVGQEDVSLLRNYDVNLQGCRGVSVGVVYGTDYISAKDYLISRYLQLELR